jgi:glycosyltransferase involved in cell wall biosynthesis
LDRLTININPLVSIMMPAYNAELFVAQAIESAISQTYNHWEIIVVDDGSTDSTAQILARYTDPRVKVFHQPNGGEACARNTALDQLQGEFLAFLDADDIFLPHHLQETITYLKDHPEYDGVYSDGEYIDSQCRCLKLLSARRRGPFEGDLFEQVIRSSDVFGAPVCIVVRSQPVFERKLRFDPEIVIGPDWDFLASYAETAKFGYLNQVTCQYRVHQSNISRRVDNNQKMQSLARCREKAIQMTRFSTCSAESREFVFYDLLINLLGGYPEHQELITGWEEFSQLPAPRRARLLRLMASQAMARGDIQPFVQKWLHRSRELNAGDARGLFLEVLFKVSPFLCKRLLNFRSLRRSRAPNPDPFAELFQE